MVTGTAAIKGQEVKQRFLCTNLICRKYNYRIGNMDVLLNGGRLQPGCYTNENDINQCN